MAKQKPVIEEEELPPPTPFEPGAEIEFELKHPELLDVNAEAYQPGSIVGKVTPCIAVDHVWLADAIRLGKVKPVIRNFDA